MFFLSREIKDQMVMKGQRWDHRLKWTTNPLYLNDEFTHIWKSTHPQAIQDVDEFVSSSEQILWNVTLHHFVTSGSW